MGVYSGIDTDMRYGGDSAAAESPFTVSDDTVDIVPFAKSDDTPAFVVQQSDAAMVPKPAAPVFEDEAKQQAEAEAAPAILAQLNEQAALKAEQLADAGTEDTAGEDEEAKRKAHEEAEAKRKAEWEVRQTAKKAALQEQLDRLAAMSDDEVMEASTQRIGTDIERLTRRNMKECVSEHIQTLCLSDPAFARKVMHPRKTMIHCIWYINQKAREFAEQEMKDNSFKPENGIYGCDVPDDLCYQWAEDYFNDPNAKEDMEKEEKFVPKPYIGGKSKSKGKQKKEQPKKALEKKSAEQPNAAAGNGEQLSMLGAVG